LQFIVQAVPKSVATTFEGPHFLFIPKNTSTNFYDFWHTSTSFYFEHIVDSKFINFIRQNGNTWLKLITWIMLSSFNKC